MEAVPQHDVVPAMDHKRKGVIIVMFSDSFDQ